MKQIIIILATILLGVYIGGTLINGEEDSLKESADTISGNVNTKITNTFPEE